MLTGVGGDMFRIEFKCYFIQNVPVLFHKIHARAGAQVQTEGLADSAAGPLLLSPHDIQMSPSRFT